MYTVGMGSLSEYGRTAGAVHSLGYHLVWCPKYRRPVLVGRVAERLGELIGAKCAELGWTVEALEVMPDHVHLFARCGPDASPARLAHQLKGATSRALRAEFGHLRSRLPTLWSRSYLVASVGRVSEATIRRYIAEQTTRPTKGMP
jgi:putative transposase